MTSRLSEAELKVVRLLATGLTIKEVAHELGNSPGTVSVLRSRAIKKTQGSGTMQLVLSCIKAGFVDIKTLPNFKVPVSIRPEDVLP